MPMAAPTANLDASSLEVLVMATSAWLEVVSSRKQAAAQREADEGAASGATSCTCAGTELSALFRIPLPRTLRSTSPRPRRTGAGGGGRRGCAQPHRPARHRSATATDPFAGLSAEDADTHRKAQRFARLLVDEIKLYNQAKVAEGRRNKDLYDRLKEDIEKSRGTFQKRYGNTVAASGDYFQKEVVRSLAEDDLSVMGANFRK